MKTASLIVLLLLLTSCAGLDNLIMEKEPATGTNGVVTVFTGEVNPTIKTATSFLETLPLPWAGVAGTAIGWLATAYTAIRRKKVNIALVTGIEAGRKILNSTAEGKFFDNAIRTKLIEHQEVAGVLNMVSKIVNDYTSFTTRKD